MKWSELREVLPAKATAAEGDKRQSMLVQAVRDGSFVPISWAAISIEIGSYLGIVYVSNDALKVGEPGDSCRINVTHRDAQLIVDHLGLAMLTDKVADEIHRQAGITIPARLQPDSVQNGTMAHTGAMERHSSQVDGAIGGGNRHELVSTVGKHWITHDKLLRKPKWAVNYGWHDTPAPYRNRIGQRMWQTVGTAHNWTHVDYSQVLVPMSRIMLVNGEEMLVDDVMRHPELSVLLSYDGPMKVTRHPQVDPPDGGVPTTRI